RAPSKKSTTKEVLVFVDAEGDNSDSEHSIYDDDEEVPNPQAQNNSESPISDDTEEVPGIVQLLLVQLRIVKPLPVQLTVILSLSSADACAFYCSRSN
ncbi:hypothetical protein A2U01_0014669, partial [Trifolium medium]|nr:hypothetical protein [Trifolium medium]